jgi:hypothetical protein
MRPNHDDTEYDIQRKQRQTEGLGLWGEVIEDSRTEKKVMDYDVVDIRRTERVHVNLTTHPDSVAGNSQAGLILRHLQSGATLTALDALDLFGCNRLAARIADLRAKGYRVQSTLIELPNGKRVASYALLDK